jgi:hypothetical protein
MRKTECELNASFGLIRVFASAALEPGNFMAEDHWSRAFGSPVWTVFNTSGAHRKVALCLPQPCNPAALKPGIPFPLTLGSRASGALPPSFRGIARPRISIRFSLDNGVAAGNNPHSDNPKNTFRNSGLSCPVFRYSFRIPEDGQADRR